LNRKSSLIEWYLAQRGSIAGYRRAIYTGLTTAEIARAIEHFILYDPDLSGLWHLASSPITKFDLLNNLTERLQRRDVDLRPQDDFVCDRSLDITALNERTKYRVPSWAAMLDELTRRILERGT
jgi:dTDP-4-dehydrorhamnose reductase